MVYDAGDWIRVRGSTLPLLTGPSVDHTLGNSSGGFTVKIKHFHCQTRGIDVKPEKKQKNLVK